MIHLGVKMHLKTHSKYTFSSVDAGVYACMSSRSSKCYVPLGVTQDIGSPEFIIKSFKYG